MSNLARHELIERLCKIASELRDIEIDSRFTIDGLCSDSIDLARDANLRSRVNEVIDRTNGGLRAGVRCKCGRVFEIIVREYDDANMERMPTNVKDEDGPAERFDSESCGE